MKSIDFKSLLIGILGTLLVIACTGASPVIKLDQSQNGRYMGSCDEFFCHILDTKTGEWVGRVRSAKMSMDVEEKLIREYE